ncbi:hypothetical protein EUA75_02010, partial [TM7 phylum sp. oral taxon 353]
DYILGDVGNDVLIGGEGNDEIKGGTGNDTYIFNKGDGADIIEEADGFDKICLGEGIAPDDVVARVSLVNSNEVSLELSLKGTGDKITVRRQFGTFSYSNGDTASPSAQIEQITFADGTIWGIDEIYRHQSSRRHPCQQEYHCRHHRIICRSPYRHRVYRHPPNHDT